ncbi:hypothetical protein GCM10020001_053490 [Nonomuraea salmonea]
MARRQARFTAQDLAADPRLRDHSPDLWRADLGEVQRGLLSSAVRCFAANGFHATTTRDIAECVGLSPAALYVHFPSKELVLFEVIRAGHERVLAHIRDPAIVALEGSAERLRAIVSAYTVWHARHHVTARVCQMELNHLTPPNTTARSWNCATRPTATSGARWRAAWRTGRSRKSTSSGSRGRCCR